ncbi:MAG: MucR family transcriptional regulator [Rhodospirillales bacterium 69-11]|nr:MAG: MucR family transcriptional regulator [Rhodospirillales bacterium 69-11]
MNDNAGERRLLELTATIVSAHVSRNALPAAELPALIQSVFTTLAGTGKETVVPDRPQPAVPIKRSVFPDHIICLEDGKKLKMLKRHLANSYQMTPAQYRERWGLSADYPMVAPNYAARRSTLAKEAGLGRKPAAPAPMPAAAMPTRKGRKKAAA